MKNIDNQHEDAEGVYAGDGYVPSEFTYELPAAPEAVVAYRQEQYLLATSQDYGSAVGSVDTITFTITGEQMVDLASLKLVADCVVENLPNTNATGNDEETKYLNMWDRSTSEDNFEHIPGAAGPPAVPAYTRSRTGEELRGKQNVLMSSSMSWFTELVVESRGGEIIERIDDAATLGRIVECLSFGRNYSDHDASFFNAEWDPVDRNAKWQLDIVEATQHGATVTNKARCTLQIAALHLLGFLNTGKFIKPSMFGGTPGGAGGGITFRFKIAPDVQIFTMAAGANVAAHFVNGFPTLKLKNVRLIYDTCIMSDAYAQWFRQTYENKGMRIVFDSYQARTEVPMAGYSDQTLQIQLQAKRAKAFLFVMRWAKQKTLRIGNYLAFESEMFRREVKGSSFYLNVGGTRYPNLPIDSAAKAHAQLLTVCYARGDVHRNCMNFHEYVTNWSRDHHPRELANNVYTYRRLPSNISYRTCGNFIGCIDFERYNTSGESGIAIVPSTTTLQINIPSNHIDDTHCTDMNLHNPANGATIANRVNNFRIPLQQTDLTGTAIAGASDTLTITAYLIRSQAITVINGRVLLDY